MPVVTTAAMASTQPGIASARRCGQTDPDTATPALQLSGYGEKRRGRSRMLVATASVLALQREARREPRRQQRMARRRADVHAAGVRSARGRSPAAEAAAGRRRRGQSASRTSAALACASCVSSRSCRRARSPASPRGAATCRRSDRRGGERGSGLLDPSERRTNPRDAVLEHVAGIDAVEMCRALAQRFVAFEPPLEISRAAPVYGGCAPCPVAMGTDLDRRDCPPAELRTRRGRFSSCADSRASSRSLPAQRRQVVIGAGVKAVADEADGDRARPHSRVPDGQRAATTRPAGGRGMSLARR